MCSQGVPYNMLKQTEASTYRLAWAKKELATSRVEKVTTTPWRRVDCTRGCGKPLGKLILYGGGWQDLESVSAALTLASKCSGATFVGATRRAIACSVWNCPWSRRRPSRKRGRNVATQWRMPPGRLRLLEVPELAWKQRRRVTQAGAMCSPSRTRTRRLRSVF